MLPLNVRELQVCEIRNGDTGAFENMARLGPGQTERGEFVADVGDLNIIGDDIVIEELQYFVSLPALRIHKQRVATLEDIDVRLNVPLCVQQEGVDAVAAGK